MCAPPSPDRLVHDGRRERALAAEPPVAGHEPAVLWLSELWDCGESRPRLPTHRQVCSTTEGAVQAVVRTAQALMGSDEADLVGAHFRQCVSSADGSFLDNFERSFREWGRMLSQPVLYFVDRGGGSIGDACKLGARNEAVTLPMARNHYETGRAIVVVEDRALHAVTLIYTGGKGFSPSVNLKPAVKHGLVEKFGALRARARPPSPAESDDDDDDVHAQADAALRSVLQAAGAALARDDGW